MQLPWRRSEFTQQKRPILPFVESMVMKGLAIGPLQFGGNFKKAI